MGLAVKVSSVAVSSVARTNEALYTGCYVHDLQTRDIYEYTNMIQALNKARYLRQLGHKVDITQGQNHIAYYQGK